MNYHLVTSQSRSPRRNRRGFTLIELLVVIAVIMLLMGMLMVAIQTVRISSMKTATRGLVTAVSLAMEVYRQEDRRRYHPPVEAGGGLTWTGPGVLPVGTLNLIERVGYKPEPGHLDESVPRALIDDFDRPVRYAVDNVTDGTPDRPAPVTDWNPAGTQPYAYVWSLGRPGKSDADDALPANAAAWIYRTGGH